MNSTAYEALAVFSSTVCIGLSLILVLLVRRLAVIERRLQRIENNVVRIVTQQQAHVVATGIDREAVQRQLDAIMDHFQIEVPVRELNIRILDEFEEDELPPIEDIH